MPINPVKMKLPRPEGFGNIGIFNFSRMAAILIIAEHQTCLNTVASARVSSRSCMSGDPPSALLTAIRKIPVHCRAKGYFFTTTQLIYYR